MQLYYLSFAGPDGWRGSVIVPGDTLSEAVWLAIMLDVNPGGEVRGHRIGLDQPQPPPDYCGRLLSRDDVNALDSRLTAMLH